MGNSMRVVKHTYNFIRACDACNDVILLDIHCCMYDFIFVKNKQMLKTNIYSIIFAITE